MIHYMIIIVLIFIIFILGMLSLWLWYYNFSEFSPKNDLLRLARKHFANKEFFKASELLLKYLTVKPESREAQYLLGQSYVELNEYDKAKEYFDKVLKASPQDKNVLIEKAKLLEKQGELEEAKELYKTCPEKNIQICGYNLALINIKQENYKEAKEILDEYIQANPEDEQAAFSHLQCEEALCDYTNPEEIKELIQKYEKISKKKNIPKEFYLSEAIAYAKIGQLENALKSAQIAAEKDAENAEVHKILGLIQLVKFDLTSAKNSFTTALHLDQENEELHELLAYVLCQQKGSKMEKNCKEKYKEAIRNFLGKIG